MNALSQSAAFWIAMILGLIILYILPSVIGAIRKVEFLGWLIVINLLPTGVGWLAALVGALMLPRREPPQITPPIMADGPPSSSHPSRQTRETTAKALDLMLQADARRRMRDVQHTN